ncbi:MAG: Nif3-like dinuclear metal center hexameric protein [Magnetococcales bacterium]|nr:Nif3-like dinuclear metal center hexameric protein [Magnetococcales bacterium]
MIRLTEMERFLADTLQVAAIADYTPNGVQVRGREEVHRVIGGVSACLDLFRAADEQAADLILVHHGMFWNKDSRVVQGNLKERLVFLLERDLTLMAYHLPLDRHAEYGNNAMILKKLNLMPIAPFGFYQGSHLSSLGESDREESITDFVSRVCEIFGGEPLVLPFGPERIRRVAVCSGAAPELVREAKDLGADLFLTGEPSEPIYHFAREEGIHVIAAGHHRTEKFGVQEIGMLLARRFGLEFQFIDIPNPI